MDLEWFWLRFWRYFWFDFRMLCACVKTTKIGDSTKVLLDFSRSGATDFDDFRTIVSYHFPQLFLNQFWFDFWSILGSTVCLKSMRLRIFFYICFHLFKMLFFIKKLISRVLKKRVGGTRTWLWRARRTPHSHKNRPKTWEGWLFSQMVKSGAVRKGARGKVNLTPWALREGMRFLKLCFFL